MLTDEKSPAKHSFEMHWHQILLRLRLLKIFDSKCYEDYNNWRVARKWCVLNETDKWASINSSNLTRIWDTFAHKCNISWQKQSWSASYSSAQMMATNSREIYLIVKTNYNSELISSLYKSAVEKIETKVCGTSVKSLELHLLYLQPSIRLQNKIHNLTKQIQFPP